MVSVRVTKFRDAYEIVRSSKQAKNSTWPRSNNKSFISGLRYSCGALQRHPIRSSARWKHRRDVLYWQWGALRHLFPYFEAGKSNIWWLEPSCISKYKTTSLIVRQIFIKLSPHRHRMNTLESTEGIDIVCISSACVISVNIKLLISVILVITWHTIRWKMIWEV